MDPAKLNVCLVNKTSREVEELGDNYRDQFKLLSPLITIKDATDTAKLTLERAKCHFLLVTTEPQSKKILPN